jgi:hypothetical protein
MSGTAKRNQPVDEILASRRFGIDPRMAQHLLKFVKSSAVNNPLRVLPELRLFPVDMCFAPRAYLCHTQIPLCNNMNYIPERLDFLSSSNRPGTIN